MSIGHRRSNTSEFTPGSHCGNRCIIRCISTGWFTLRYQSALDNERDKLNNWRAWSESKGRDKADDIREAEHKTTSVHVATLMDWCHLKHSELAEHFQQFEGRVVCCVHTWMICCWVAVAQPIVKQSIRYVHVSRFENGKEVKENSVVASFPQVVLTKEITVSQSTCALKSTR